MRANSPSGSEIHLQQILHQIRMLAIRVDQSRELDEILKIVVSAVRKTLKSDRAIIYRFLPDGDGVIAQEAVNSAWKPIIGQLIYDPCFKAAWVERYQKGWISVTEDVNAKTLEPCYQELLTSLQVQANLVVPILLKAQKINGISSKPPHLWGLLIAQQCSSPRKWSALEIEYLNLLAAELGIALGQTQQPQNLLQLTQHLKNFTVQPKLKLKPIKKTLHQNNRDKIITETTLPKHILTAELRAFDRLQTPTWIYDIEKLQMWWANKAALHIWNAQSREELLNRNFSDISESTRIRLQTYLQKFQQGQTITENWTFYPEGKPVWVRCLCSGIEIAPGRMAMLVEGSLEVVGAVEQETLRSIEALRHTTVMISLYTMDGVPQWMVYR
jgi:hypothetical protein